MFISAIAFWEKDLFCCTTGNSEDIFYAIYKIKNDQRSMVKKFQPSYETEQFKKKIGRKLDIPHRSNFEKKPQNLLWLRLR